MHNQKVIREMKSILLIIVSVLVFRSVLFEPFRIPTGSMIPTLMIGDFILVNKFAYGFKVPFTDIVLGESNFNPVFLFGKKNPERGDVIVFKYPKDLSVNYIKRVIGLPGDTIEMKNKIILINGKPLPAIEFNGKDIMKDMDDKFKNYNLKFYNSKTGKHNHILQQDSDNYFKVDMEKTIIPKNNFFVMGDNRDFSADSRYWGFVSRDFIKGKAIFVWFSMIFPIGENEFKFRPHRIGKRIN